MKPVNKNYDFVLVGCNFASLTLAHELEEKKKNFCLIDSSLHTISPLQYVPSLSQSIYTSMPFVPWSETLKSQFKSIPSSKSSNSVTYELSHPGWRNLLGKVQLNPTHPLTFEKGEFKNFSTAPKEGGEKSLVFDLAPHYGSLSSLSFESTPEHLWEKLIKSPSIQSQIFMDQQVTGIHVEKSTIHSLQLNGHQSLCAKEYLFFNSFPVLLQHLSLFSQGLASKMGKMTWSPSLSFIIHHESPPENFSYNQVYALNGRKPFPLWGGFSLLDRDLCLSRWECTFPSSWVGEGEKVTSLVKDMKKRVQKAFPSPWVQDHLYIRGDIYAHLSQLGVKNGRLKDFNNLHLCSPLLGGKLGWLSEIQWSLSLLDFWKVERSMI